MAESIAAEMKAGKSEVVCEQGQLLKLSKDKEGIVKREVLTRAWTDWVDYWAVDFDYESRKEIIKVAKTMGVEGALPGVVMAGEELLEFEERGPAPTSSRTSGKASAPARTASSSSKARRTPTRAPAATLSR